MSLHSHCHENIQWASRKVAFVKADILVANSSEMPRDLVTDLSSVVTDKLSRLVVSLKSDILFKSN